MRWGLYLTSGFAAAAWGVVGLTTPGARAKALRITYERQYVMADLGAEYYLRGAKQVANQSNMVARAEGISPGERSARLNDYQRVALNLGGHYVGWQRMVSRLDTARLSIPVRIWPKTEVIDASTGLRVWTGASEQQLVEHDLKWLRADPRNQQLIKVATHWAAPGAPLMPSPDLGMEFE
ncbi:hypothetical protein [Geothrix sp. PMB-07]|uniref:hypothetical protein n=1 Tax=Geothrix sp. PMB-07 TaxID=3068640 RepID=UPI002742609F|nr:hypothetical protein [Geothrix sp. PMB-07]WLT30659.1 hypothetical protein Q9293_13135 [Geothrix sp. PMB-07]